MQEKTGTKLIQRGAKTCKGTRTADAEPKGSRLQTPPPLAPRPPPPPPPTTPKKIIACYCHGRELVIILYTFFLVSRDIWWSS